MPVNDRKYNYSITHVTRDDWRFNLCEDCRRPFADGEAVHVFEPHSRFLAYTRHCEPCARKRGMTTVKQIGVV